MHIVGNHETKSFLMDGVGKKIKLTGTPSALCSVLLPFGYTS